MPLSSETATARALGDRERLPRISVVARHAPLIAVTSLIRSRKSAIGELIVSKHTIPKISVRAAKMASQFANVRPAKRAPVIDQERSPAWRCWLLHWVSDAIGDLPQRHWTDSRSLAQLRRQW
jgi:hypothetical protein